VFSFSIDFALLLILIISDKKAESNKKKTRQDQQQHRVFQLNQNQTTPCKIELSRIKHELALSLIVAVNWL